MFYKIKFSHYYCVNNFIDKQLFIMFAHKIIFITYRLERCKVYEF